MDTNKIIVDLCGGTGAWSAPYLEAGYDVRLVSLPGTDVRSYEPPVNVYGVLAAPPCTHFSVSGAQYWKAKDADGRTFADITILTACLMIIARVKPVFWAIENPVGRMRNMLGPPDLIFNPCDFGDPWTKKTYLWGEFNPPALHLVTPIRYCRQGSWIQQLGGSSQKTKKLRAITPPGFARAFFEANR